MSTTGKGKKAVEFEYVHDLLDELFAQDHHAARVRSLAGAVTGVIQSGALGVHAIGRGLAAAAGLCDKHAVKQVDRCIGNEKLDVVQAQAQWSRAWLAGRSEVVVNLDWTEFAADGHSMVVLSAQTDHGRAMPLMWTTVLTQERTCSPYPVPGMTPRRGTSASRLSDPTNSTQAHPAGVSR